jgi:predicted dehydrogenase
MERRNFLKVGAAGLAAAHAATGKRYRAAVIGHTGHGDYGHGWDTAWNGFDSIEVVAVADPDDTGRQAAMKRCGATRGYRDYREMLHKEKPGLVSIGPRWTDQRREMVTAAAEAGAHILLEKPFAPSLTDADAMVAAVEKNNVKLQVGHQMRTSPTVRRVRDLLRGGEIGVLQEVRGRGKEDSRAGGEDLTVLGAHIFDVMRIMLGDPRWAFAHATQDGREIRRSDVRQASEPIGPIAGNQIAGMFAFDGGVHGYFGSKANDGTHPNRFGYYFYGSKGVIYMPNGVDTQAQILRSPAWMPDEKRRWEKIEAPPEPHEIKVDGRGLADARMVRDLLEAIEQKRDPVCSARDGRWTVEMVLSLYQSQKSGARVEFPLKDRRHPLETL